MLKWILRIAYVVAALLLAAALAIYLGGPWAVERHLEREMAVGGGTLRIAGPEFRWNLDLTADSLLYRSPALDARAAGARVSVNLFRSLFRFSPSLDLDLAAVDLKVKAVDDSLEEKVEKPGEKGPPRFPEFDLPASVHARIGRVHAAGDTAELGWLEGVALRSRGKRSAGLTIARASLPALPGMLPSLAVDLDWRDSLEVKGAVDLRLSGEKEGDGAVLAFAARRDDLRRGRLELKMEIDSLPRYRSLLGTSPWVTGAGGWDGTFRAGFDVRAGLRADLALDGTFGGLTGNLPVTLGRQRMALRLDFRDTAGTWSFRSDGGRGENVDLEGGLAATAGDSLQNPAWLFRHLAVTLSGKVGGIPVKAAGRTVTAELEVARARWAPGRAGLDAKTGDGSRIKADLLEGRQGWNGAFSLEVAPGEAWMLAFVDTNVAFRRFTATGKVRDGRLTAMTEALYLKAYGVEADTLTAHHRYGPEAYVLEKARLSRKGTAWALVGKVDLSRRGRPMELTADGGPAGWMRAAVPRPGAYEFSSKDLSPHRIPYRGLDSLEPYALRVTADFRWDQKAKDGRVELSAVGQYRGEAVKAGAEAAWDRTRLEAKRVQVEMGGSRLLAAGAVHLAGRQFYELKGLGVADLEGVALEAEEFDLAKALRALLPEPPLLAGTLQGRFAYRPDLGFAGSWRAENLQPAATRDLMAVKQLLLRGDGDTLRILAVTVSQKEPLLNDSVMVSLTGVLADTQALGVEVKAGPSLRLGFRGSMDRFRDLQGLLSLGGSVQLPGKSGNLRGLKLRAAVSVPFRDALAGLRVEADTLLGEYEVPGVDTQAFSAPFVVSKGRLVVPDLTLRGRQGSLVRGSVDYALTGARVLEARLAGGSLVVQVGSDKVLLRDLKASVRADSLSVAVQASIGSGSFEHAKGPLRAVGDFSRVEIAYRSPLGKAPRAADAPRPSGNAAGISRESRLAPAVLRVSAVLDTSHVRYRLRSLATLKNVFRRPSAGGARRQARAGRPLEVSIDVATSGSGNLVETDVLRFAYVGDISLRGVMPYALMNGRITGTSGELGTKRQAYDLRHLELKWLNAPPEEGEIEAEAFKRLRKTCDRQMPDDSCQVITRLVGGLDNPQFAYDSDCKGSFGSGADPAALLHSVRRGCYSNAFAGGGSGMSYEEQALALLEPFASQYLTRFAGKLTSNWIETANVTGLGTLASDTAVGEAVAMEVWSREFWRLRMHLSAGYQPQDAQEAQPYSYRVGLVWKPPLFRLVDDARWQQRIRNNVTVEASVFRDPSKPGDLGQSEVQRKVGLNYTYDWWGRWWSRGAAQVSLVPDGEKPE